MGATPLTRPGQLNGTGDENALFLQKFSGEVLAQFKNATKFAELTQSRTLSGAKSAIFPVINDATSKYHTAGESVYGTDDGQTSTYLSNIKGKEREIFADDPVLSGVFVPRIDELKNHWEVRSRYSTEIGNALAQRMDYQILSTIYAASKQDADFYTNGVSATGASKSLVVASNDATVGANLITSAFAAAQKMDEMNIPKEGRIFVVRPKQYYILSQVKDLLDRDYVQSNGDYSRAEVLRVAGMRIMVTNNMPTTENVAGAVFEYTTGQTLVRNHPHAGAGGTSTSGYTTNDDATPGSKTGWNHLAALAFHPQATGTVKMAEISSEMERSVERRGTLLLSSYVAGHNVLRPECAIGLHADTI